MPATISQVKDGLKAAINTVSGLRAFDYQPDQVNPPFAWPTLDTITYHQTGMASGGVVMNFTVTLVVNRASERTAQDQLDQYMSWDGAKSLRAAIEADRTLGGVCDDLIVNGAENLTNIDANDTLYLAVDFKVVVYA
ncbi:MAG: hypothetical protein ACO32O_07990 [Ilumatobacteraceae bacterium]